MFIVFIVKLKWMRTESRVVSVKLFPKDGLQVPRLSNYGLSAVRQQPECSQAFRGVCKSYRQPRITPPNGGDLPACERSQDKGA